jgi:ammonia channel protein AmtB
MENIARQELKRFSKRFLSYGKVIVGGMLLSALFFFFYAGIETNNIIIEIMVSIFASLLVFMVGLFIFGFLRMLKKRTRSFELHDPPTSLEPEKVEQERIASRPG